MLGRMQSPALVFKHTGFTVHAAPDGNGWSGEILSPGGQVQDQFAYTRDAFPGAVIGALGFTDLGFAGPLALRKWLHTDG